MSSTDKYNFAKINPLKRIPAKLIGFTDDELNINIEDTSIASKGTAIRDFYNKTNKLDWYDGTLENRTGLPLYNQALSLFKVYTATSVVEVGYEIELKSGTISDMNDLLQFENAATITQWYINGYAESEANVRKCINAGGKHLFSFELSSSYTGKITLIETNSFGINLFRDWYFKEPIQGYERVEIHNRNPDKAIQKKLENYCPFYEGCNYFINFYLVKNTIIAGGQTVRYKIPKDYSANRAPSDDILVSIDDSEITGGVTIKLFDTDGATELASNFAAINTDLEANDRTGGFLEVSGLPTWDVAKVVITISDFPTVSYVCGGDEKAQEDGRIIVLDSNYDVIGNPISEWQSQFAPQFNAMQTTLANRPLLSGNEILFDGTNDFLTFGNVLNNILSGNAKFTFFVEFKINSLATQSILLGKYADSNLNENQRSFYTSIRTDGSFDVALFDNVNNFLSNLIVIRQSTNLAIGINYRLAFTVDMSQTGNAKVKISLNGVTQVVSTFITFGNGNPVTLAQTPAPLAIGSQVSSLGASTSNFNGSIKKVVLFNTVLTQTVMNGLTA